MNCDFEDAFLSCCLPEKRILELKAYGLDFEDIKAAVDEWGTNAIEKGYIEMTCNDYPTYVPGAIFIARIDELSEFDSDLAAAEKAYKDGVELIEEYPSVVKYIDTPENRKIVETAFLVYPEIIKRNIELLANKDA